MKNLRCRIFGHVPVNLDTEKGEADCRRCGARLSVRYDGRETVVCEEIAREGEGGLVRDDRNGNLYPLVPEIRTGEEEEGGDVIAIDANPEAFEIQGYLPREHATVLPRSGYHDKPRGVKG